MRIRVKARVADRKNGVRAKAVNLPLTGHGPDRASALGQLRKGVLAWCYSLARRNRLEQALGQRSILWEPGEGIAVDLQVESPT